MHNINQQISEEECPCLPEIAWFLLVIAFVPHVLALIGFNPLAQIASCGCFPASMGPFALAHAFVLINRLGFTSHMSWISAVTFSLIWSAILYCTWRKNRKIAMGVSGFFLVLGAILLWLFITPLS